MKNFFFFFIPHFFGGMKTYKQFIEESKSYKMSCKIKSDITEIWSRALIDTKPRLSVHGQIVSKSEWRKQNNNCSS